MESAGGEEAALQHAQSQLHELLQRTAPATGPQDEHGAPRIGMVLSEWVVVASWMDPHDGETYVSFLPSEHLVRHHAMGLLMDGLDALKEGG